MKNQYDVVIIGAGNGGLTAAVKLQQNGVKTLLIEKHNIPGGCATSFVRGDFEFEVALHQLSGMGSEDSPFVLRNVFADLGVLDRVEFIEEHELYRLVIPGKLDITLPASVKGVAKTLKEEFPKEEKAIDDFLHLCMVLALETYMALPRARKTNDQEILKQNCQSFVKYGLMSTKEVLDKFFDDENLKATISAYWGYLGLPTSELPFSDYGPLFYAYAAYKPYYIKGGSQALSNALLEIFLEAGGEVRFNCAAEKILTQNGQVYAVRSEHGDIFHCRHVVSNCSSILTYNELLDDPSLGNVAREDFKSRRIGVSGLVAYIGLDCSPEELGVTVATTFVTTTVDDEEAHETAKTLDPPKGGLLTCYNFVDPSSVPKGKSLVSLMNIQYGEAWDLISPDQYAKTKYEAADHLIDLVSRVFPKLRDHIEEIEIGTPLTMMRYLNTPGGAIYGFAQNASESSLFRDRNTSVDGLSLVGSWVGMGGFQPTYMAGVSLARYITKRLKNSTKETVNA